MTCNHQLRVLGNPDDGRGDRETKQRLKGREERKQTNNNNKQKKKDGHFTAHTSHNRNQELSGGGEGRGGREGGWWGWDQREAEEEEEERGKPEEAQETKPLASVFTMHVKQTTKWPKTFFLVVKIWGVVTKKKKKIYLYDKPTEGGGEGGGSLGDQFVKCVYFFQLYFLFFTITIYFL